MIREALATDKSRVISLLRDSRVGAGFDRADGPTGFVFPFDPVYAERLFLNHLAHSKACCIVHDVGGVAQGVLMAVAFEHAFGPVLLAKETVWWIDPAHRGSAAMRMLDVYENWASEQECVYAGMAGMGDDPTVGKLYARRGYNIAETHYLKGLA